MERKKIAESFGYEVTTNGDVYSTKRHFVVYGKSENTQIRDKKLRQNVDNNGYMVVSILFVRDGEKNKMSTKSVHRLVAMAFLPNPLNKPQVNHIDGDKSNNNLSNLEWSTASENVRHAYEHNLMCGRQGEDHHLAKLTNQQCIELISDILSGSSNDECAKKYNLHTRYVSLIRHKKRWKDLWSEHFNNKVAPKSKKPQYNQGDELSIEIKTEIFNRLKLDESMVVLSKIYNINRRILSKVKNKKTWMEIHNDT